MTTVSLTLPMAPPAPPTRARLAGQLLSVAAVFAAATIAAGFAGLRYAGPVAVIAAAIAALWATRSDGPGGAAVGLTRASPLRVGGWTVAGVLLAYVGAGLATVLATKVFGWPPMRTDALGALRGHLPTLLGMLAIAWSSAAIGEELLFRGFLQGRLQALFGGGRGAGLAAAVAQAAVFGVAHAYQGPTGMVVTGIVGLVFGLVFLRTRMLWPVMLAHGIVDTIGLLALYAGVAPAG